MDEKKKSEDSLDEYLDEEELEESEDDSEKYDYEKKSDKNNLDIDDSDFEEDKIKKNKKEHREHAHSFKHESYKDHSSKSSNDYDDSETIKIDKAELKRYVTFIVIAAVVLLAFAFIRGNLGGSDNVVNPTAAQPQPVPTAQVKVSIDDDAILGDKNAPVTLIEFSDYQCPFCGRHYTQTWPSIKSQYVDTGKVRVVFRDFPLESIHPQAMPAAIATECVREKGGDKAYFEYHDVLFENQQSLSTENYKLWAKDLGYNIDTCLDSGKYRSEVQKDLQDATAAGGQGTPFFVIIGEDGSTRLISGAQPFTNFQSAIDAALG